MSESKLDFSKPIRSVQIFHRNPGTDGYWNVVLNSDSDEDAINRAVAMFEAYGFNPVIIDKVEVDELTPLGGEADGE